MASSSKSKKIYDVFLSFRGEELRTNFVSHLHHALHQIGIYTFLDSEELKKGDEILMLMKAIEESRIAIIVFSKNYASSTWCLKEVAKIMECKKQNNLTVLPVFYKVEPREVRGGRALTEHESKFGKDSEEVKIWKKVLSEAGSLSGWHLNYEDESKLIQRIVKEISTCLNRTPLHVAKHPIGIDSRVDKLKSMLHLESDGVVMVGLWGQGGIGKSTLARALYNAIFRQFEGSCLLADVREARNSKDLISLQENLLLKILSLQQKLEVFNVNRGISLIQHRLCHKKVLLILDDVDDLRQLNALAGEGKWFGNGSRIIVTTRDIHLLTYLGIDQDHVYNVRELNHSEACQLLCKHAFPTHQKLQIKKDLVVRVLNHAKGLPLALEVLGSFLCGRREDEWKSTLKKLSRVPDNTIFDVLKISYDGLDKDEQQIFLHIACFFKGWDNEYIKKVLDSCDFAATIGLQVLFEKSLISIEGGKLQMHDLIQLMGMDIVRRECHHNPGRRSRLWLSNDVVNVLSCDMEDCAIEAIVLKLPKLTKMCIGPDAFTKMRRLRLLILRNVHNSFQGHICLPNELRWFEWPGYADRILKFSSGPKRLVGLNMSQSNITIEPKQFKDFQYLKYINFSHCKLMVRTPDLSCTPHLKELDLSNCKNLVEVHESVANLKKLQVLNLRKCSELSVFPNVLKLKNLRALNFCECIKFERFPDIPHKLKGLKELWLVETAIKELPTSIENLVALKSMNISHCKNLEHLPYSIYKLQNLRVLNVEDCTNLIRFPKYKDSVDSCIKVGLSNLEVLKLSRCNLSEVEFLENLSYFPLLSSLNLNHNNITTLPTSINKRDHLSILSVENCHQLREIPELPPHFDWLRANNCKSLQKSEDLTSIDRIVRRCSVNDPLEEILSTYAVVRPQEEMPQWVFPIEGDSVFFMISKDLYDKILGLAFCAILRDDEEEETAILSHMEQVHRGLFFLVGHADGTETCEERYCELLDSDHIYVECLFPNALWKEVNFAQIDGRYIQFGLGVEGGIVKKRGFRIICKQLGDDLKAELRENQLIDPALLYEVSHGSIDSAAESSHVYEDNSSEADLPEDSQDCQTSTEEHSSHVPEDNSSEVDIPEDSQDCQTSTEEHSSHVPEDNSSEADIPEDSQDCQTSTEEHSQIGSKRKREFNLPLSKRIKTMFTSIFNRWRRAP